MLDSNNLVELIKKASHEANEAAEPCDFLYGKVTSEDPLKILVEQKIELGRAQLVLTRNVTNFQTRVFVDWDSQNALNKHSHLIEIEDSDFETSKVALSHSHAIKGSKTITINNGLKVGDEVVLIKKKGGQEYLVLDRVVSL